MSWIFQAIPKRYDLESEMEEDKTETWLVTRYRDKMKKGDLVFLWSAGSAQRRGIYGWGRITEDKPKLYDDWGYGIKVHYKKVFPEHLSSEKVKSLPELNDHLLFRMAIGTNFEIDDAQTSELINLIEGEYGVDMAPHQQEIDVDGVDNV